MSQSQASDLELESSSAASMKMSDDGRGLHGIRGKWSYSCSRKRSDFSSFYGALRPASAFLATAAQGADPRARHDVGIWPLGANVLLTSFGLPSICASVRKLVSETQTKQPSSSGVGRRRRRGALRLGKRLEVLAEAGLAELLAAAEHESLQPPPDESDRVGVEQQLLVQEAMLPERPDQLVVRGDPHCRPVALAAGWVRGDECRVVGVEPLAV